MRRSYPGRCIIFTSVAVQPNNDCIGFCNWLLNISAQRLSTTQRALVNSVYTAALAGTPISNQDWYNFNLFTAWRNQYYIVYNSYVSASAPALLLNLISSYNLEGSSADSAGGNNGTDTAMVYGLPSGKVLQGGQFNGVNSSIVITPIPSTLTFTIALWFYPQASVAAFEQLFANGIAGTGLYWEPAVQRLNWFTGASTRFGPVLSANAWHCVVVRCNAGSLDAYIDNVYVGPFLILGAQVLFNSFGSYTAFNPFVGYMDILNIWSSVLSASEASLFYNGGSGLQYPFH